MIPPVYGRQGTKKETPAAEKVCGKSLSVHSMPRGLWRPVVTKRYGAVWIQAASLTPFYLEGIITRKGGFCKGNFLGEMGDSGKGHGRDESLPYGWREVRGEGGRGRRPRRPAEGSRPLPTMWGEKGYKTEMGCHGRLRAAYMPPLQSSRSPLRGFGGTPDSKVEEGPMALRTDSNTASV